MTIDLIKTKNEIVLNLKVKCLFILYLKKDRSDDLFDLINNNNNNIIYSHIQLGIYEILQIYQYQNLFY